MLLFQEEGESGKRMRGRERERGKGIESKCV